MVSFPQASGQQRQAEKYSWPQRLACGVGIKPLQTLCKSQVKEAGFVVFFKPLVFCTCLYGPRTSFGLVCF